MEAEGNGKSSVDEVFARYLSLDPADLDVAAEAAQENLEKLEEEANAALRRGRKGPGGLLDAAYIENGAAAFAELVQRAQNASEGDYGAQALQGALYGNPAAFDEIMARSQAETLDRLHSIVDSIDGWIDRFAEVGLATFRAQHRGSILLSADAAEKAVKAVGAMLRAERARRLSAADGDRQGKSERNRARRARERLSLVPGLREEYARYALVVSSTIWGAGLMGPDPEGIVPAYAKRGEVPGRFLVEGRAREGSYAGKPEEPALEAGSVAVEKPSPGRGGASPDPARLATVAVKVKAEWVHAFSTKPNARGETFYKAVVNLPAGTAIGGRDLGGYSFSRFMKDFHKTALAEGRDLVFRLPESSPVELCAEGGETLEVDAWSLTKAVKAVRERGGGDASRGGRSSAARSKARQLAGSGARILSPGARRA